MGLTKNLSCLPLSLSGLMSRSVAPAGTRGEAKQRIAFLPRAAWLYRPAAHLPALINAQSKLYSAQGVVRRDPRS